ncbi:MAG: AAA family ATPase [candidate division WOR-3 bacterium]|nr:MAG: AAA family ATPase [candidate division WOR-3 bacterium]
MRIKSIRVGEYGPLRDLSMNPGHFDVVFGLNEAGKTAFVEVLGHVLFKRSAAGLRYGKPEGAEVELQENDRTCTLPAKRLGIELPVGDVANLLYVQASESIVFSDRGTRFWDGIKTMLSKADAGIPFTKLDEQIFKAVELQPTKEEWTRAKQAEIDGKRQRKEALGDYLDKIGEIGKKEAELSALAVRHDFLKKEIEKIGHHRAFRNYQELVRVHHSYVETRTVLQEYERYKHEYLGGWQKLNIERAACTGEGQKVKEIETEVLELERKRSRLSEIDQYISDEGLKQRSDSVEAPRMPSVVLPSVIVLLAAIAAAAALISRVLFFPALFLLAGSLSFFGFVLYRRRLVKRIMMKRQGWLEKARKVFPEVGDIDQLFERIGNNQTELIRTTASIEEKKKIIDQISTARAVDVIDGEIEALRAKTGLAEPSDLEAKLSEKRKLENELADLATRLSGLLQENDSKKWERMINERKVARPEGEADLAAEKELISERDSIRNRIDELTRSVKLFREVEQARSEVSDDRTAFIEYDKLDRELRNYELEKHAALKAREILKSMSSELDQFIGGVLEGEDSLSEFIRAVTGRYEKVFVENENFIVEDRSGRKYALDDLSSGTKDQLLLCFRMAALRQIYPNGAFMILDDAFIFADWQRRERLAKLVQNFVEKGNQVIYLTSDDHTRDLFAGCGARVVTLT